MLSLFRRKLTARNPPAESKVMGAKARSHSLLPISSSRTSRPVCRTGSTYLSYNILSSVLEFLSCLS